MNEIYQINEILKSGKLSGYRATEGYHLGGRHVQAFEGAFKDYFEVAHAISLNSATAGLYAALVACGVGRTRYDEVVVTPYSFSASASCVLMAKGHPKFIDIDEDTFCIDSKNLRMHPDIKVILPVHLCGQPADMDRIMEFAQKYNLRVVEDCAQSIGATHRGRKLGTIGDCGIFSFNQSKHINTGEGGMLITNDDDIARKVRAVRNHGEVSDPDLKILGYNFRMCEIEAVIGLEQFKTIDQNIAHRIRVASLLTEALKGIVGLTPPKLYPNCKNVFYTYALRIDPDVINLNKVALCEELAKRGIYFGTYVKPLYLSPIYQQFGYGKGLCPVAERMYERELIVTDIIKDPQLDTNYIGKSFREIIDDAKNRRG